MENDILKKLKDHERRLGALEKLTGKAKKQNIRENKKCLSEYIIKLRDSGFFSKARTADETHKKLREAYHCELNRVAVALIRLAAKKKLRKTSTVIEGKKYKAYVW